MILLLLWESALALFCQGVVTRWVSKPDRAIFWFSLNIVLAAFTASIFSFLKGNTPAAYLVCATLFAMAGAWLYRQAPATDSTEFDTSRPIVLLSTLLFGTLWVCCMRPVSEVDSLYNLHFVLDWWANRTNPYDFAFHYVPFWELASLPTLVLARSDAYFWLQAAKPVALLGCILWRVAVELGLPPLLRQSAIIAALLFPPLWFRPSGVATLKNDMLHAAGEALLALILIRGVRQALTRADVVLLALSTVFLSVKFSGPVFLLGAAVLFCLAAHRWIRAHLSAALRSAAFCFAVWLVTVGHCYLHNALTFGNPFYPFQINVGPVHLPGLADLSGTAITASLHDPRLWRAFFLPANALSPAGLLFPITLAAILILSPILAARELIRPRRPLILALCLFQLAVWGLYFRSIYGASGQPGDLLFILNDLNSIRYVEGALLVAELFFLSMLMNRVAVPVLLSLVALNGASRLYLIFREPPPADLFITGAVLAAVAALALRISRNRPRAVLATAAVTLVALVAAAPTLIEQQRRGWLPEWQSLYRLPRLVARDPGSIYLVVDGENSGQALLHLPLGGISARVRTGTWAELPQVRPLPDWIVRMKQGDPAIEARAAQEMPEQWLQSNHYVSPQWLRKQPMPANGVLLERSGSDQAGK